MSKNSLKEAKRFCRLAHADQKRKGTLIPYYTHPFAVKQILSKYTRSKIVLIAALLHDVTEDTEYSLLDIHKKFSAKVANLVKQVSETKNGADGQKLPWSVRKYNHLMSLYRKGTKAALMIKVADNIHNLESTLENLTKESANDVFNSTIEERLWYSKEVLKIARDKGVNKRLLRRLKRVIRKAESHLTS